MHRDLKAECAMPPAKIHVRSRRPFTDIIEEYYYPDDIQLQYVTKNVAIRWKAYYWIYDKNTSWKICGNRRIR